jgi:hypothetical protein
MTQKKSGEAGRKNLSFLDLKFLEPQKSGFDEPFESNFTVNTYATGLPAVCKNKTS